MNPFLKLGGGCVSLSNINLHGELRSEVKLLLIADIIIRQNSPVNTEEIKPIQPGTFIICYKSHPDLDYVLYSKNRELIVIQVSTSAYADHESKRSDLEKLHPHTAFDKKSVASYYRECTGVDKYHYIYITTNSRLMDKNTSHSDDEVILVNSKALSAFDPVLWQEIKSYFKL